MDPIVGPAIGAGATLGGGLLSGGINWALTNKQLQAQREALQHGIRWRVADAKAAGLHPLFALGANVQAPSPMVLGDTVGPSLAEAGQSLGGAISRMGDVALKNKMILENKLLESQIGESDARKGLYQAEASKIMQQGQTGLGIQSEFQGPVIEGQHPNPPGFIDINPAPVVSSKSGHPESQAGLNPFFEEQLLAPGFPIMLPRTQGESAEEIISEMSPAAWLGLLLRNSEMYGKGWLEDLMRFRYLGKHPRGRYDQLQSRPQPVPSERKIDRLPGAVRDAVERAIKKQGSRRRFRP